MNSIVGNAFAVICTAACAAVGIWAWWLENGPGPKDRHKDKNNSTDRKAKPGGE